VVYFLVDEEGGILPSTKEDIEAVYSDDIGRMSFQVEQKFGKKAFYNGFKDMPIRRNGDYDPTWVKNKGEK
jgi:hypothetical protein